MSPQKNYFFKLIFFCETSSPTGHLTLNVVVTYAQRPFLSHFYVQENFGVSETDWHPNIRPEYGTDFLGTVFHILGQCCGGAVPF